MGKLSWLGGVVLLIFSGCSVSSSVEEPDANGVDASDGAGGDEATGDGGGLTDKETCQDECTQSDRFCDGNGYRVCGQSDADSCVEWSERIDCQAGETCQDGMCGTPCQDYCISGMRRCTDSYNYETCGDYDGDSCYEWGGSTSCGTGLSCDEGQCVVECTNQCSLGDQQCADQDTFEMCGDFDADPCLEFGNPTDCPAYHTCEAGQCVLGCQSECTDGEQRCVAGVNAYEVCADYNGDTCFEWGAQTACGYGEDCDAGQCVTVCTDECTGVGEQACVDGQEAWVTCAADHDADECLEWGGQVDCLVDEICDTDTGTCINAVDPCSIEEIVAAVDQQHLYDTLEELTAMGSRYTWSQHEAALALIEARLQSYGVDYNLHTYSSSGNVYKNVEIIIPGTTLADEIYLAGGHYDSVSGTQGADDNASGTSGVIEVARVLADCQYKRTIRLVLFSKEESGLTGSINYANDAANAGDDILGMYGVDMIGYGPANEDLDACTKVRDAFLAHAVETASNLYVGLPVYKDIDDQCG